MSRSQRTLFAAVVGGAAIVVATVVVAAHPSSAKPVRTPAAPDVTRPGSSGPGVAVFDATTGRTVLLPPAEAAAAIRDYWTPERMAAARPAP
jgi:anti-sigma-K factor RskA